MPDDKSISQLTLAEQLSADDLFEIALANGQLGYLSRKVVLSALASFIVNDLEYTSDLHTVHKKIIEAINELLGVVKTGTLTAGSTSITFADDAITANSIYDVYVDEAFTGVSPTAVTTVPTSGGVPGSVTFTFPAQLTDMPLIVFIKEVS
jgi:hypothetical protein